MNFIKNVLNFFVIPLVMSLGFVQPSFAAGDVVLTNKIESVDFTSISGGRVIVRVVLKEALANPPAGFTLSNPARIAIDFPKTANGLLKNTIPAEQGALKSVTVAQAKDRSRMVLNLSKNVGYNVVMKDKEVQITLQGNEVSGNQAAVTETKFADTKVAVGSQVHAINNVDFARGKNGEGRIIVDLSDASTGINIKQKGKQIVVDFINTDVPANLQRRLNVINFNTPVLFVDTMKQGKNGRLVIEPTGNWEQSAYQADKKFIIDVRRLVEDPNKLVQGSKPGYAGEKLSLNFQNIEVRSVLQVIADFTGLNIIASDTVAGNITLRLKDVPWDQAMDIIMANKGLTMRKNGNVILVAPADEVAAKEKSALEAMRSIEDLEPLRTEVFTLKYQKAEAFKTILLGESSGGGGGSGSQQNKSILSKRGSAVIDPRTNTLFVQDTAQKLEEIQSIINKTDIAVRQVMIESRLVVADDKFSKALGARFGITQTGRPGSTRLTTSGTLGNRFTAGTPSTPNPKVGELNGGTQGNHNGSLQTVLAPNSIALSSDGQPDLMSNLPVANAFGGIAFSLLRLPAGMLLNLELSALESDQRGKVVSSPRVTTANQQKATISQGTKIPYLQASSSGAANVTFIDATLSLEVTPQITPDEKIIMDLIVKKDRVGAVTANVPSIDTQNVSTQVLVSNGETAVLGGIYEETSRNGVDKVPFFGDLPIVGNAFKRKSTEQNKSELLIFVTPKIMDETLNLN